jgi:ATP-dependent RNA helicase YTHDC2
MSVEPRLGKIILASIALRCLDPVLTIVCCLSRDDTVIIPASPEQRKAAIARKTELGRDHLSFLKAYHLWETAPESRKRQVHSCGAYMILIFHVLFRSGRLGLL